MTLRTFQMAMPGDICVMGKVITTRKLTRQEKRLPLAELVQLN